MTGQKWIEKNADKLIGWTMLDEYVNAETPIRFQHSCGEIKVCTPHYILRRGCSNPECIHDKRYGPKPKTLVRREQEIKVVGVAGKEMAVEEEIEAAEERLRVLQEKLKILEETITKVETKTPEKAESKTPEKAESKTVKKPKPKKAEPKTSIVFSGQDDIVNEESFIEEVIEFLQEYTEPTLVDGIIWAKGIGIKCWSLNSSVDKGVCLQEEGARIIHLAADEWYLTNAIVRAKILRILKIDAHLEKVDARQCYIQEIEAGIKNKFLNENHVQGQDRATYKYGLFRKADKRLVSVMTITKCFRVKGQGDIRPMELSRFASDIHLNVRGAFSKLLKHAQKELDFNVLETFADLRWSFLTDNVYLKNGFEFVHVTSQNYWYIEPGTVKRLHRFNFRKAKLEARFPEIYDPNKTEKQIMSEANYRIFYDAGNLKLVKNFE